MKDKLAGKQCVPNMSVIPRFCHKFNNGGICEVEHLTKAKNEPSYAVVWLNLYKGQQLKTRLK